MAVADFCNLNIRSTKFPRNRKIAAIAAEKIPILTPLGAIIIYGIPRINIAANRLILSAKAVLKYRGHAFILPHMLSWTMLRYM